MAGCVLALPMGGSPADLFGTFHPIESGRVCQEAGRLTAKWAHPLSGASTLRLNSVAEAIALDPSPSIEVQRAHEAPVCVARNLLR